MRRQRLAVVVAFAYVLRRRRRAGLPDDLVVLRIGADAELWLAPANALVADMDRAVSCKSRRVAHTFAMRSAKHDALFALRVGLETTIKGSQRGDLLLEVRMRHPLIMAADRVAYWKALADRSKTKVEAWTEE